MTKLGAIFWGILIGLLIPLIILSFVIGCATANNIPKCTWICPTTNIPNDCYCLEEEIQREAGRMSPTGFHP